MKIRPLGVELLHAGGRTDMTKLIVAFHNFGNSSKNVDPAFLREALHKHVSHPIAEKEGHCKLSFS
jgi:hypothetical protein